MPTDYSRLTECCWARDPWARPSVDDLVQSLSQQLTHHMQQSGGGAAAPPPSHGAMAGAGYHHSNSFHSNVPSSASFYSSSVMMGYLSQTGYGPTVPGRGEGEADDPYSSDNFPLHIL